MQGLYCFYVPADQDLRMICAALSGTFLCSRLFRRACGPLVSSVPGGDATHDCEVVSVGGVTEEEGQCSLLTDAGEPRLSPPNWN